jgi:hypothetical protein
MPWSRDAFARKQFWHAAPRAGLARLADVVQPEASLSAANHLGAHFALRKTLRLFPDGWDTADLVLVDIGGRDYVGPSPSPEAFRPLMRSLVATRELLAIEDGLAVFGRGVPSPDAVARLSNLRTEPTNGIRTAGSLGVVVARLEPDAIAPRESFQVRYTWMGTAKGTGTPCVTETLAPAVGSPVLQRTRPVLYGLLAGRRWPAGMIADEAVSASVPETALPGVYTWSVAAWDDRDDGSCGRPTADAASLRLAQVRILPW